MEPNIQTVKGDLPPDFPYAETAFVRDVVWYEGPLLTHLLDSDGRNVFRHWHTADDEQKTWTWLYYPVSIGDAANYYAGMIPILTLWERAPFMWRVCEDKDGLVVLCEKITLDQIPEDERPSPKSFYDKDLAGT